MVGIRKYLELNDNGKTLKIHEMQMKYYLDGNLKLYIPMLKWKQV